MSPRNYGVSKGGSCQGQANLTHVHDKLLLFISQQSLSCREEHIPLQPYYDSQDSNLDQEVGSSISHQYRSSQALKTTHIILNSTNYTPFLPTIPHIRDTTT